MDILNDLFTRLPQLESCRPAILYSFDLLVDCARHGGTILTCGNGGSAADAEHIVGELMKRFRHPRALDPAITSQLPPELTAHLEGAIPAISLVSMSGLITAFANDVAWDAAFAQQVLGLGRPGDALIALSTSGNSANCVNAALVARAKGMRVISFTGAAGGRLATLADAAIQVPESETYKIQELHLPVYHALCAALEAALF